MSFIDGLRPTEGSERVEQITVKRNEKQAEARNEKLKETKQQYKNPKTGIDFTV